MTLPEALSTDQKEIVGALLDAHGYDDLTDTQQKAFSNRALAGGNTLLTAPTGNGKTLTAEAIVKQTLDSGGSVGYLVPSTQLVQEKAEEIEEWTGDDYRVGTGSWGLRNADIPVMTFESFFQSIVRGVGEAPSLDHVVFDDFHTLYSYVRGPAIEKSIAACLDHDISMHLMSATVGNPETLSSWTDAHLIESDEPRGNPIEEQPIEKADNMGVGEQIAAHIDSNRDLAPYLVFNNSRRWSKSRAGSIAETELFADASDRDFRSEIEEALPAEMTSTYRDLADMMSKGVAFHHSGLDQNVRELIVDGVNKRDIMAVSATPGLAYGFDAPINSVIVAGLKRGYGEWIGVYEYIQWVGRAGRPGYGYDKGHAFPMWSGPEAHDRYQFGVPAPEKELEPVETHIDSPSEIRRLVLELIEFGWESATEIEEFMKCTLYWQQMQSNGGGGAWSDADVPRPGRRRDTTSEEKLQQQLRQTADWLIQNDFITERSVSEEFETTDLGSAAVEFIYGSWVSTTLSGIKGVYNNLPRIIDTPAEIVRTLMTQFDRLTPRNVPEDEPFMDRTRKAGVPATEDGLGAALITWCWGQGMRLDDIEQEHDMEATGLPNTARRVGRVIDALSPLVETHPGVTEPEWLGVLAHQIEAGVPPEDVSMVRGVDQFGRGKLKAMKNGNLAQYLREQDSVDTDQPIVESLRDLYEKTDRQQFKAVLRQNVDGVGQTISSNIADYIDSSKPVSAASLPPTTDPEADTTSQNRPEQTDGFTTASDLSDF